MSSFLASITIDYLVVVGMSALAVIYVINRVIRDNYRSSNNDDDFGGNQPKTDLPKTGGPTNSKRVEREKQELELVEY